MLLRPFPNNAGRARSACALLLGQAGRKFTTSVPKQGAKLAALGIALGAAGAFAATRVLASALYEIKPADPATFSAVAVLLAAATVAANYVPARRAAQVDPMATLRIE